MMLIPFIVAVFLICLTAFLYIMVDIDWVLPVGVVLTYIATVGLIIICAR